MIHFKTEKEHSASVKLLQKHMQQRKGYWSLSSTGSVSNTLRNGEYKQKTSPLDLSHFNQPITLDTKDLWITVEPRMTVRALCEITLDYGLVPPVVPEFNGITVGGAVLGGALESSSHRFGQFNDCCLEYEVLLGDGTLLITNRDRNSDLFYGLSGSYGTLAILTLVTLQLIPAKRFVRLQYHPCSKTHDLFHFFRSAEKSDFVDGVVISPEHLIGMEGTFTDTCNSSKQFSQHHAWNPWFYHHLFRISKNTTPVECIPVKDYLFRFDRGAFWMGYFLTKISLMLRVLFRWKLQTIEDKFHKHVDGRHPKFLFRLLFGWAFSSQRLYRLWHAVPKAIAENIFFIQDFYIPFEQAHSALQHLMQAIGLCPVWLCPVKGTKTPQFLSPHYGAPLYVNLGFYGIPGSPHPIPRLTAQVERDILSFGGRKMLYSLTYYSKEDFSKIYDSEHYTELRKKFYAEEAFLPLYKKVTNML